MSLSQQLKVVLTEVKQLQQLCRPAEFNYLISRLVTYVKDFTDAHAKQEDYNGSVQMSEYSEQGRPPSAAGSLMFFGEQGFFGSRQIPRTKPFYNQVNNDVQDVSYWEVDQQYSRSYNYSHSDLSCSSDGQDTVPEQYRNFKYTRPPGVSSRSMMVDSYRNNYYDQEEAYWQHGPELGCRPRNRPNHRSRARKETATSRKKGSRRSPSPSSSRKARRSSSEDTSVSDETPMVVKRSTKNKGTLRSSKTLTETEETPAPKKKATTRQKALPRAHEDKGAPGPSKTLTEPASKKKATSRKGAHKDMERPSGVATQKNGETKPTSLKSNQTREHEIPSTSRSGDNDEDDSPLGDDSLEVQSICQPSEKNNLAGQEPAPKKRPSPEHIHQPKSKKQKKVNEDKALIAQRDVLKEKRNGLDEASDSADSIEAILASARKEVNMEYINRRASPTVNIIEDMSDYFEPVERSKKAPRRRRVERAEGLCKSLEKEYPVKKAQPKPKNSKLTALSKEVQQLAAAASSSQMKTPEPMKNLFQTNDNDNLSCSDFSD